jgi:hypothetical protein
LIDVFWRPHHPHELSPRLKVQTLEVARNVA